MQSVYLHSWLGNPLHCPFCGTYVEPELSGIVPNCQHLWAVLAFGELMEVSPSFISLVKHLYEFKDGINDDEIEILAVSEIKTPKGLVPAAAVFEAVQQKIDELGFRAIEFQTDGVGDVAYLLYVFDELE